mmetsp:Transcript_13383/g.24243  ORF Transcript_13383/g.24243 Transcript_13383/m.24243 type:complete len:565 (-) Transcript_13383:171-1865(-)
MSSITSTFVASLRSVGTACTMAMVGVYLHRRNFVIGEGKRTLALISQQVTIPAFLFSKIVFCNQDWSDQACPSITDSLSSVWMLLFWPAYVVGCGLLVGYAVAKISHTPSRQFRSVLVACSLGNSTGLPITLLTVVHANFPKTTELGRIDPTLFLSVYLLLYPVLQWGIGGWLLAPDIENKLEEETTQKLLYQNVPVPPLTPTRHVPNTFVRSTSTPLDSSTSRRLRPHNVVNNKNTGGWYKHSRRGLLESDASLYITQTDLEKFKELHENLPHSTAAESNHAENRAHPPSPSDVDTLSPTSPFHPTSPYNPAHNTVLSPILSPHYHEALANNVNDHETDYNAISIDTDVNNEDPNQVNLDHDHEDSIWHTLSNIASRCLQPPVIGAMLGLFVSSIEPLRGMFVDLVNRADAAPLEWAFDGIYAVGQAAVPLNMIILGCNLSASQFKQKSKTNDSVDSSLLSLKTMTAIVVGKMIVMPIIGIVSVLLLNAYFWDIPADIDASFYLVAMIVFITPTANNVMVMVELSGSGTQGGIARVIGWQYALAPILLSLSMTAVVGVASQWS